MSVLRVEFTELEHARRVIERELAGLGARQSARLAGRIAAGLRDAGSLGGCVDKHYSAADLGRLLGRSKRFVAAQAKAGAFGRVFFDSGGWMIPASGVREWLSNREHHEQREILEGIRA